MMLLASAIIATALGGCPKPVHHVKHKPDAPLCSCVSEEPRVIMLPAPTPEPEPIELNVVRYYVPLTADAGYEPQPYQWDEFGHGYYGPYGYTSGIGQATKCPEIDPASMSAGLTLLAGGVLVLRGKRS